MSPDTYTVFRAKRITPDPDHPNTCKQATANFAIFGKTGGSSCSGSQAWKTQHFFINISKYNIFQIQKMCPILT